jgi:FkbH-like protein
MLKELEFPFDPSFLITQKKKLKRKLLEGSLPDSAESGSSSFVCKKIAVLGGVTTDDVIKILELFLLNYGIKPEFYESEYNQFYQESIFPSSELEAFNPDLIYICTSIRNISAFPSLTDSSDYVDQLLLSEYQHFEEAWSNLQKKFNCPVIQNNFDPPFFRLLGNKDATDLHGRVNFVNRLNQKFAEYAQKHDNFYICDINYIASDYGISKWANPHYWHMYKYPCAVEAIPYLSFNVANIIKSIFGKNKKGFVLDLDNTLWGGVVGDDGVNGIQIGPEESEGQAYLEFQNYLKSLKDLGIVLNINSKNDEQNAIDGLNKSSGVLKTDDFIVIKANWNSKDINFAEIATTLNLLPESLVFVDDNPVERQIVSSSIKNVSIPEITEINDYITVIDRNGYFETTTISKDDVKRNQMYKENAKRIALQSQFTDYKEFLLSLEMLAEIKSFVPLYIDRIAQLTNKSNQFNLTTHRYTASEITEISNNKKEYITLYGKLKDKFGDNGVVSVVIGQMENDTCYIRLWLMSCRVLKRDMEFAMMDALVKCCLDRGIKQIYGYYYPTAKNSMVKDFYKTMGYELVNTDPKGNTTWKLDLSKPYSNQNHVIRVED